MHRQIIIHAEWDAEAGCWVAEAQNLPGLATGAKTLDELFRKLPGMIQDLLEDEDGGSDIEVPFELVARGQSLRHHAG